MTRPDTAEASRTQDRAVGYACAALVTLVWAGFILVSRHGVRVGDGGPRLTPFDLGALRFGVSGLIAAGLWAAGFGRGLRPGQSAALAAFAGLGFALPAYCAFSFAPAAHGAVLLPGTLPFLVAAAGWLVFGDRWTPARRISLVLVLGGILLLAAESYGFETAPPGAWRGDLLFLLGSTSWAAYTVLVRRWGASPAQVVVSVGIWSAVAYLPVWWLALPSALGAVPLGVSVFQGIYQGFFAVTVALFLFTQAMASLGAARLTTITALTPGLAGVLAVPLLGEPLGALALAGLLLVCVGVVVGVRRGSAQG